MNTQNTQNTQRSAGVDAAAPDLLRERDDLRAVVLLMESVETQLRARLAASEAIRAELVGALEQTLDALYNETAITKDSPWITETKAKATAALANARATKEGGAK